ncbi:NADH dehydrogenase [ubiquinone] 1 alpha subcomplex assembly factor 4 [Solea senegalensis]|uniref:NADH dehydrogenase [ubiquinone] 1 alpha subcomplex assembly factor 4 n=1 Tax=Solea senegalensis TaxID=28829 RepID=A0AAV6PF77_SOLSE|nr:NADH dehydrogenase [ubiquinone] 1 alpha subcomplex assembly factor 4-like [Solea senegalensis]KAG7461418.1 NADH dehydrogenase [ubiquinone] 1 alpha subcomplex assembly factor 4 [Solea senegalensis]
MGARVARMFRNFNLEDRAFREISKEKPQAAPRHAVKEAPSAAASDGETLVHQRNDPLLNLLRSVYVESTDPPAAAEASNEVTHGKDAARRPLKFTLPGDVFGLAELTDVPKGKLTIAEALKALSSHQRQPRTWTPGKIAQEYSLDLTDTKALVEFFIPFQVKIISPKSDGTKQIQAS